MTVVIPVLYLFLMAAGSLAAGPVIIDENTVWKGDVEITGEVIVEARATLVVLPGSRLSFVESPGESEKPETRMIIRGQLVALGTVKEPVTFTSSGESPGPGDWGGIIFDKANGGISRIKHCRIEYAKEAVQATLSSLSIEDSIISGNEIGLAAFKKMTGGVFNCEISGNSTGLYLYEISGMIIENCRIFDNSRSGIFCTNASSPVIRNCEVSSNGDHGIYCAMGSSPLIEGNMIAGQEKGVFIELNSRPGIFLNEIRDNRTGVWSEKRVFPRIGGNVISGNGVGLYCNYSGYPQIRANSVFGNERFSIVLGDNQSTQVDRLIPFRDAGRFLEEAPQEKQFLPAKTRKYVPFGKIEEGFVDARGNWWGEKTTEEMEKLGESGNVTVFEDAHDKPTVEYSGRNYPRDMVAYAPWEKKMPAGAGRPPKAYSGIRGKALFSGKPLPGALVHLYQDTAGGFKGEGFTYSMTAEDGTFSVNVQAGKYFLVVKKPVKILPHGEPSAGDYFGYYGGNPVTVAKGEWAEANIQAVRRKEVNISQVEGLDEALLEGVVVGPDGPVKGAALLIYYDSEREFRGPGLFGPRGAVPGGTGPDGDFSVELPPGEYYLVAVKKEGGNTLGPVQAGDLYGYYDGNPVELKEGLKTDIVIQQVKKIRQNESMRRKTLLGISGIRGGIRDSSGNVPEGVFAFASPEPALLGGMPPYRSLPAGPDGGYFIDMPEPGTYYVGARSGYGGPPLPGESFGLFGGDAPVPVKVEEGKVTENIDITIKVVK